MDSTEGAWILALIAMIGAVCAGLFKLVSKNGCRIKCYHPNGTACMDLDCDEGREGESVRQSNKSIDII